MCVREAPYANCLPRMPLSCRSLAALCVCIALLFLATRRGRWFNVVETHNTTWRPRTYTSHSHTHTHSLYFNRAQQGKGTRWRRSRAEGSEPTDSAAWFLCAASASLAALPDRRRKVDSAQLQGTVGAIDVHSECL